MSLSSLGARLAIGYTSRLPSQSRVVDRIVAAARFGFIQATFHIEISITNLLPYPTHCNEVLSAFFYNMTSSPSATLRLF